MEAEELARIRSIPLATVLEKLGAERDPKDPTRNWKVGASRITVTDFRFYDHNQAGATHRLRSGRSGGGGAIDLVQYLKDVGFRDAVQELAELMGRNGTTKPATQNTTTASQSSDSRPVPQPAADRLGRARWYLSAVRAIPERIVDRALESGNVFTDTKGNVVFRLSNDAGREVGYEVRGTYERPYHSVHGEKGLFIVKAGSTPTAAFVESGIEALSYQALRNVGLIISTTGNAVELPNRFATALKARGYGIVAAFNADKAGDRMSEVLAKALHGAVRRDRPQVEGKDWNDQLQLDRATARQQSVQGDGFGGRDSYPESSIVER